MSLRFRLIAAFLLLNGCAEVGKQPDDGSDVDIAVPDPSVERVVGGIAYGQTLTVYYKNPPKWYSYGFDGRAGDDLDVRVRSDTGDSMVRILDAHSKVLTANDDADGSFDSHATLVLVADGKYYVSVRDYNLKPVVLEVTLFAKGPCQKHTCAGDDAECGSIPDGCGGTLDCGTCTAPETCGGGGTPNVCGSACSPRTCADAGASCGSIDDGCGETRDCGTCAAPETCGGGGTPNVCGTGGDPYGGLSDDALKAKIHDVESQGYVSLGYTNARKQLYEVGGLSDQGGTIECIYTGTLAGATATGTAPSGFNTEHTWPASLGAENEPMHSDLNHLFPTTEAANSARANYYYGMTSCGDAGQAACNWTLGGSQLGPLTGGGTLIFEVRPNHRGDVARAWFYFSTRYRMAIPDWTEAILKDWNAADPPDDAERARNDKVEALQHTRNVFIDRPDLASRIRDF